MTENDILLFDSIGRRITGVLHRPEGTGPFPAVIIAHGFKSNKNRHTELASKLSDYGIASLRFDFFGCGDSDGRFEHTTIQKMLENLRTAVDYMAKLYTIKPDRVGLFGRSMGGLVSILQASSDSRIKAMVLSAPVSDIRALTMLGPGKLNMKRWDETGFVTITNSRGDKFKLNYSFWEDALKRNAYREANRIECPTLIMHGDKDREVPLAQSKRLFGALKSEKKEFQVLEGCGHIYSPEQKTKTTGMAVEWFRRWL